MTANSALPRVTIDHGDDRTHMRGKVAGSSLGLNAVNSVVLAPLNS
jgi:hypothetical protein